MTRCGKLWELLLLRGNERWESGSSTRSQVHTSRSPSSRKQLQPRTICAKQKPQFNMKGRTARAAAGIKARGRVSDEEVGGSCGFLSPDRRSAGGCEPRCSSSGSV
ncbi:hypothetical protein AMECASPLE_006127 [Ameca splendens]|uniref:Uncharacterized protein n=1 Tax=Ameca splendens TaxID=208324 RepID=A0ABV0ZKF5_9TELE